MSRDNNSTCTRPQKNRREFRTEGVDRTALPGDTPDDLIVHLAWARGRPLP